MDKDLKTMMDTLPISDINQEISEFIHSGDGYENKLKLTLVMLYLIEESSNILRSVDISEFISQVREKTKEIDKQANSLAKEYHINLQQNNEISEILTNEDNRISELQGQISDLLTQYDTLIGKIVATREKLPIQKQLELEKK